MQRTSLLILPTVLVLALVIGGAEPARAWGSEGHRIVGEIAWHELNDAARQRVLALLPSGRYSTLYEAATWPDTYARNYSHWDWLKPLHYVDVPPNAASVTAGANCECVVAAIPRFKAQLADASRPFGYRVNALRIVAHFVGDIHQPLHVSHPDDHGGNDTHVRFDGKWGKLHTLWDTGLIQHHLATPAPAPAADSWEPDAETYSHDEFDWQEYARDLMDRITPAKRQSWTQVMDPKQWATESLALAKVHTHSITDGTKLDSSYFQTSLPVIEERLQQAGVRLGALLNEAFGSANP